MKYQISRHKCSPERTRPFPRAVERGAKLPSLQVLERIANGLRVEMKDLFNFDRTAFRKVEPPSRRMLDLAITLQLLPAEQRRRILKILNTLLQS
jgi:hypothetical protein